MRIGPGYRYRWVVLVAEVTTRSFTPSGLTHYTGNYGSLCACAQAKARVAPRASDPSTRKVAPESLTSTPATTAAQAPITPARAAGKGRSQASIRRHRVPATGTPAITSQKSGLAAAWAK